MDEYEKAFKSLNSAQRSAVEQIDGPVLVIAGPGTGKTQLLSTRVGYILKNTDALPQNILCLTFTEAGVEAMRERLTKFLGQDAYDVHISTYHSFGSDLIRYYPEYAGGYDLEPIDELGADSLIREILEAAPYSNPLKYADTYARTLGDFISDAKRALLTPADLMKTVKSNYKFIDQASDITHDLLADFSRMGPASVSLFDKLAAELSHLNVPKTKFQNLKDLALGELQTALEGVSGKDTKSLTAWKNNWLAKDGDGRFIFDGMNTNRKIEAAAKIYEKYQTECQARRLYDYDDMILRGIKALEDHPDFKFSLAERYLYILLDEFQDTNRAQMRLVELLTDNPVNEGRPNILAVGDDDQAIYAFQGAELANMHRFSEIYRDVNVIPLTENYRSNRAILDVAHSIGEQIEDRLHNKFESIDKVLSVATTASVPVKPVSHHSFISDAAQYEWIASEIKALETKGVELNEIAVLAPKHRYLMPVLAYLSSKSLPLRYEKRENVLDKPVVRMLEQMSALVVALYQRSSGAFDALWPEVLSYDFWQLDTETIWRLSWQAETQKTDWTNALLKEPQTENIARFFLRLKDLINVTSLEQQLDILVGVSEDDVDAFELPMRCPFFEFYFGRPEKNEEYIGLLSDLSVLRGRLRRYQPGGEPLNLADFLRFTAAHRASGINILNSSPHHQAENAVNIMTAFQAKGREFGTVFIIAAQDDVWGPSSRSQTSALALPPNLKFIRYRGDSDDERLRLLYVAITRAKERLILTSYAKTLDGKPARPLKYLAGQEGLLSEQVHKESGLSLTTIEPYWHSRHVPSFKAKLEDLLKPRLDAYQLSPTHLNQFIDLVYGGPEQFFINSILKFPKGQSPQAQYGTVMHDSLGWAQVRLSSDGQLPSTAEIIKFFKERINARRLAQLDKDLLSERGERALTSYLKLRAGSFSASDKFEESFRSEGVFIGPAHLAGKIDKLKFNKTAKTITVYDFKTGPSYDRWVGTNVTLHKYRQQLIIYKLLVENSHSYKGWTVDQGVLEFIESPPGEDKIYQLKLEFDETEIERLKKLIMAVWTRIQKLDLPDISRYPATMAGVTRFEDDLIGEV